MHKNVCFAVAAAAATVLVGLSYLMSAPSTARPSSDQSGTPRIDASALTADTKDLPSEQYDTCLSGFDMHTLG
jgi:hypothetical protein